MQIAIWGRWSLPHRAHYRFGVQCPKCFSDDDKVVDSRSVEEGRTIRRRRQCLRCNQRFTTFERTEEVQLLVAKRSGDRVPFDPEKMTLGITAACKNRPVTTDQIHDVVSRIEERVRAMNADVVTSEQIGRDVLEALRELDQVAYLRFASVYKVFDGPEDFTREVGLLTKQSAPKRH